MEHRIATGAALGAGLFLASCATGPTSPGAHIAIAVAPLQLAGVADARYLLEVRNGAAELVASREVTSLAYGAGDGSLSYVAPCDADPDVADNTVSVTLLGLYAAGGAVIDPGSYQNPGTVTRHATCVPNADVPVTFDITIARRADQGFFDVAVSFSEIYCSAKKLWGSPRSGDSLRACYSGDQAS